MNTKIEDMQYNKEDNNLNKQIFNKKLPVLNSVSPSNKNLRSVLREKRNKWLESKLPKKLNFDSIHTPINSSPKSVVKVFNSPMSQRSAYTTDKEVCCNPYRTSNFKYNRTTTSAVSTDTESHFIILESKNIKNKENEKNDYVKYSKNQKSEENLGKSRISEVSVYLYF